MALKASSWEMFCRVMTTDSLKPLKPASARFRIARIAVAYDPGPRTASLTSASRRQGDLHVHVVAGRQRRARPGRS